MFFVRPKRHFQTNLDQKKSRTKFVCKICKTQISDQKYLFSINNSTPFHTFYNPNHYRYDILTFTQCQSVLDATPPTSEFTWFAGYSWSILICSNCTEHLGWRFENSELSPAQFFGMIHERLEEIPE